MALTAPGRGPAGGRRLAQLTAVPRIAPFASGARSKPWRT